MYVSKNKFDEAIRHNNYGSLNLLFMYLLKQESDLGDYVDYLPYMQYYNDNASTEMLTQQQFDSVAIELLKHQKSYYWRSRYAFDHFYRLDLSSFSTDEIRQMYTPETSMQWERHPDFSWDNAVGHAAIECLCEDSAHDDFRLEDISDILHHHSSAILLYLKDHIPINSYIADILEWVATNYGFQSPNDYLIYYQYLGSRFTLNEECIPFYIDHACPAFIEAWFKDGYITPLSLESYEHFSQQSFFHHLLIRLDYDTEMIEALKMYVDCSSNRLLRSLFFKEPWPEQFKYEERLQFHEVLASLASHPLYAVYLQDYQQSPIVDDVSCKIWMQTLQKYFSDTPLFEELPLFISNELSY